MVLNLREVGHDVNVRDPTPTSTADIGGTILEIPVHIECKRITLAAKPHAERLLALANLAEEVLTKIRRWGVSAVASIELGANVGAEELSAIDELFRTISTPPKWGTHVGLPGPWAVTLNIERGGPVRVAGDLDAYDILKTDGTFEIGAGIDVFCAVGIKDYVASDWSAKVRSSLNVARQQLDSGKCNLVCLEIADMPHFDDFQELARVVEGIETYLDRDTKRVSGVILTNIGATRDSTYREVTEGPVRFRSAGQAWLFANPAPYTPIPVSFEVPKFDKPEVRVQASREQQ